MAITLVTGQHGSNGGTSVSSLTVTLTNNIGAGNLIWVAALWGSGTCTFSDGPGDTPTARPSITGGAGAIFQQAIFPNSAGGTKTVKATFNGGSQTAAGIVCAEFSGCQTGTTFDSGNAVNDAHGTGSGTSPASSSITPSMAGCLIMGGENNAGAGTGTAGGSFTLLDNAGTVALCSEYLIQGAAAAVNSAFTIASATWDAYALIIQPAAGGATTWGAQLSDLHNRIVQGN